MSKTTKRTRKAKVDRKPRILVMDAHWSAASSAVRRAGGEPVSLSPRAVDALDDKLAANKFDALLLMGGGDVDPRLYGEKPHKKVYGVSETRDYTEWTALDHAKEHGLPVLGICRGMQLMTVHNGGSLFQHVSGHRGLDHLVFGEKGSRFRRIIGRERGTFVSLHHQIVRRHGGRGFQVAARSAEGYIEAVESKDGRCLGVQFHPEMDYTRNEESRRLFSWLVDEAARRAGLVKPTRAAAAPTRNRQTPKRPAAHPLPTQRTRTTYGFERVDDEQLELLASQARGTQKRARNVSTSWVCRDCGIRFDKQQDRDDHEHWLHGEPTFDLTEPPPGHADWMPS